MEEEFSLKKPPRSDSHWFMKRVLDLTQRERWDTRVELTTVEGTRHVRCGGEPISRRVPNALVPDEKVQFRRGMMKGAIRHWVVFWPWARVRVRKEVVRKRNVKRDGVREGKPLLHMAMNVEGRRLGRLIPRDLEGCFLA